MLYALKDGVFVTLRAPDVIKFELSERELAGIPIILLIIYESYKCYLAAKTRSVEMTASQYMQKDCCLSKDVTT